MSLGHWIVIAAEPVAAAAAAELAAETAEATETAAAAAAEGAAETAATAANADAAELEAAAEPALRNSAGSRHRTLSADTAGTDR